jgi:DnaA family protein
MSPGQIPLALKPPRRPGFANFIAGPNQAVVETLSTGLEPGAWYLLGGPPGSGRTHLLSASFARLQSRGLTASFIALAVRANRPLLTATAGDWVVLDDIDALAGDRDAEMLLFNALNRWRSDRTGVIMAATGRDGFDLPDLRSRLGQAIQLGIKPLNDDELRRLVAGLADDQEVVLGRGAVDYLLSRSTRNPAGIARLTEQLATRALTERRALSIALIREMLLRTDDNRARQ